MRFFKRQKSDEGLNTIKNSDVSPELKKSNIYLFFIAIAMLVIFVAGQMISSKKKDVKVDDKTLAEVEKETSFVDDFARQESLSEVIITPSVRFDPLDVDFENTKVGNSVQRVVEVKVLSAPVIFKDVRLAGLEENIITENCTIGPFIGVNEVCTISLKWEPKKETNKVLKLFIEWVAEEKDQNNNPIAKDTKSINVRMSSYEPEPEPEVVPNDSLPEDQNFANAVQDSLLSITKVQSSQSTNSDEYKDNLFCKKYAAKAFDFAGQFLGWVQLNGMVWDLNCERTIGVLRANGDIEGIEEGFNQGQIIGRGPNLSGEDYDAVEKSSTELPVDDISYLKDDLVDSVNWEEVQARREMVKSGMDPAGPKQEQIAQGALEPYKVEDPLSVLNAPQLSPIKFDGNKVSTGPRNDTYIVRKNKPIPVVLNRTIRATTDAQMHVSATVERNIYGGNGRVVIIPAGTQVWGRLAGKLDFNNIEGGNFLPEDELIARGSGQINRPYDKFEISWSKFIRPDGAEFNIGQSSTGDAQGRYGVAGKKDTNYINDLLINPILISLLPAAAEYLGGDDDTIEALDADGNIISQKFSAGTKAAKAFTGALKPAIERLVTQSIDKTINPEWIVPAGTRMTIFVNEDLRICFEAEDDGCAG